MIPARVVFDTSTVALAATPKSIDPRSADAFFALAAASDRAAVHAPMILAAELAQVVHVKRPLDFGRTIAERQAMLRMLLGDIEFDAVEATDLERVGAIAEDQGLSAYDAFFIECAERHAATLVTDDRRQLAVASRLLGRGRALTSTDLARATEAG